MATGTITTRFSKYWYANGGSTLQKYAKELADGTGVYKNSSTTAYTFVLNGANFEELRNLPNVKITGFTLGVRAGRYNSDSSASQTLFSFRIVSGLTSGSVGYGTSITDVVLVVQGSVVNQWFYFTENDLPELLTWMNNNLTSLINGYTTGSFAFRGYARYAQCRDISISINYTYGVDATGISLSPKNLNLYLGKTKTNLFPFNNWVTNGVTASSGHVNISDHGLAITSTGNDCFLNTYHMNPSPSSSEMQLIDKYGVAVNPNTQYTFACEVTQNSNNSAEIFVFWYDSNKKYISLNNVSRNGSGTLSKDFTSPSNARYCINRFDNNVSGNTNVYSNIRMYQGSDASLGSTGDAVAQVLPYNASNQGYTLSSSNNNIFTVTNGILTAKAAGTATLTAISSEGNYKATGTITVIQSVNGVTVTPKNVSINVGDTETLTAIIIPSSASNKNVTWSTSNSSVATVSNGVVTAISPGIANVTVTTVDGGYTSTCVVTVTNPSVLKIKNGNKTVNKIYVGATQIKKVYLGKTEVYSI